MAIERPDRQPLIAAYKSILRDCIDQRPSGLRQKLAQILGTHKSFISQITNPRDPTPIPARHLKTIIKVCHLGPADQAGFLAAYAEAHPRRKAVQAGSYQHYKTLHIQIPVLPDAAKQEALELFIRDMVRRLCGLMANK
jgi:hypothetical protein